MSGAKDVSRIRVENDNTYCYQLVSPEARSCRVVGDGLRAGSPERGWEGRRAPREGIQLNAIRATLLSLSPEGPVPFNRRVLSKGGTSCEEYGCDYSS